MRIPEASPWLQDLCIFIPGLLFTFFIGRGTILWESSGAKKRKIPPLLPSHPLPVSTSIVTTSSKHADRYSSSGASLYFR
jgi:hypothetical protein